MPVYDFKCMKCQEIKEDVVLPITHLASSIPQCCDHTMSYHITSAPQVVWKDPIIAPFRTSAGKKKDEVITTTRGRREFMARNHLQDARDHFAPPTRSEEQGEIAEKQETIDAITPTAKQEQQLKDAGIASILNEH